jgi:uncharacterized protein (DUF433 family)
MRGRRSYTRIVREAGILGGRPHVRGTRLSVGFLLELVASGASRDDILHRYPELTRSGLEQALRWAAEHLDDDVALVARASR